jgi:hypothetical protein
MDGNDTERQLLKRINSLASELQQQRLRRTPDKAEQARVMERLQRDLAACWAQVRAERAGPSFSGPAGMPPLQGQSIPHGRNWRG